MNKILLAPSLLSADWAQLAQAVAIAEKGADWIHLDVMDGQFVPNLTFGPVIARAVRKLTKLPIDAHLMIHDPLAFVSAFREAGVDRMTVHVEARGVCGPGWRAPIRSHGEGGAAGDNATVPNDAHAIDLDTLRRTLTAVRKSGAGVGLALRPDTAIAEVEAVLEEVDLVLPMSVYPGFSGQEFRPEALLQIRDAAAWRERNQPRYLIQADGGVAADTIAAIAAAGAEVFVSGHGVYRQPDPLAALQDLRRRAEAARSAP
ncbi:MAG TPA: ribulose-phosphate 3-epimerase [Candidatus Eisenbacteria bacterium]|nr:ribulose-phosphate 3-epimerase [Candidatus Eisenbacteria bacterium]